MSDEKIGRVVVPKLDEILGQKFKVLDDGFIRVVDYMGGDASIVQSARISYGKGTKKLSEDRGLIRYLMRHLHSTPQEMCVIKLHIRIPMDCHRQLVRHRTASLNEYSTRYSVAIDECQKTAPDEWRLQSVSNKQGSEGMVTEFPKTAQYDGGLTPGEWLSRREEQVQIRAREAYEERLAFGVAREQARKDLPLSNYTELYWKMDLHNLFHFLSLRMDSHAQKEIRDYANVIGREIVAKWCPLAWEAFEDYRLGAMVLTAVDKQIISMINRGDLMTATIFATESGWMETRKNGKLKSNRERQECEAKLVTLGMQAPWL